MVLEKLGRMMRSIEYFQMLYEIGKSHIDTTNDFEFRID